jgi:Tfp pilus assembly pilus retraction ATPase PilT
VGMQTMDQSLQSLVDKHLIDIAVARTKARHPNNIV